MILIVSSSEKDEEVKLSVEEDQVLINHQASKIESLQKLLKTK